MPRFGIKSLLFVFVLVALWLSTFSGYAAGRDIRASILLIGEALAKTLSDVRLALSEKYDIDEQLTRLAIARAAVNIAVSSACQAAGMSVDECQALERQVNDVIHAAMLKTEGGE